MQACTRTKVNRARYLQKKTDLSQTQALAGSGRYQQFLNGNGKTSMHDCCDGSDQLVLQMYASN